MSVIGMLLVAIGITSYVIDPGALAQTIFVIGVLIILINYTLLYLVNRDTCSELKAILDKEDEDGFFYVLDEDYSSPAGDATIIDLSKE